MSASVIGFRSRVLSYKHTEKITILHFDDPFDAVAKLYRLRYRSIVGVKFMYK